MYGTMPISMTAVTSAPSGALRPSRAAIRSASDDALCFCARRTRRPRTPMPKRYIAIAPARFGGSHQPERIACVTEP